VRHFPLCEVCRKRGLVVAVEEVHHVTPLAEGGTHRAENLISLCQGCHARAHATRDRRGGAKSLGPDGQGTDWQATHVFVGNESRG